MEVEDEDDGDDSDDHEEDQDEDDEDERNEEADDKNDRRRENEEAAKYIPGFNIFNCIYYWHSIISSTKYKRMYYLWMLLQINIISMTSKR